MVEQAHDDYVSTRDRPSSGTGESPHIGLTRPEPPAPEGGRSASDAVLSRTQAGKLILCTIDAYEQGGEPDWLSALTGARMVKLIVAAVPECQW